MVRAVYIAHDLPNSDLTCVQLCRKGQQKLLRWFGLGVIISRNLASCSRAKTAPRNDYYCQPLDTGEDTLGLRAQACVIENWEVTHKPGLLFLWAKKVGNPGIVSPKSVATLSSISRSRFFRTEWAQFLLTILRLSSKRKGLKIRWWLVWHQRIGLRQRAVSLCTTFFV